MIDRGIRDRLIIDSIDDWIWEIDIVTGKIKTSDNWKRFLGYEPEEIQDSISCWLALVHPEDAMLYQRLITDIKNNNLSTFDNEYRISMKSGEYKWIAFKGKVYRNDEDNTLYAAGFFRDTTAHRRAEESERRFRNLVELSPHGVFIHKDGIISYANQRFLDMLRVKSMNEILDTSISDYLHPFYRNIAAKRRDMLQSGHTVLPMEMEILRQNGSKLIAEIATTTIPDKTGLSCLSYVKDMTEYKLMLEDNKKLLDQALEYDRLKTEFFANISHELKTPLNIMLSSVQLLNILYKNKDNNLNRFFSAYEKYIGGIQQNSYRLLKLVNNLIDITKFDSGFFKMDYINLNIVEIVEDITQSVAPYIDSRGISLIFDTDIEEKIQAVDVLKLERIILNLLSNAVKFTPAGGTIQVTVEDKQDAVAIVVSDTGCGIPEDRHELIFERFRQVDSLLTRRAEGSGIGLALVKILVEAHNGTLTVKSALGAGSEFTVELPSIISEASADDLLHVKSDEQSKIERIHIEFSDIYS
jgi:PAS domain S-box-containing protein